MAYEFGAACAASPSLMRRIVLTASSPGVAVLLLGTATALFGVAPSKIAKMMDAMPVMTNWGMTMKTLCIPYFMR